MPNKNKYDYKLLSHHLTSSTYAYGGKRPFTIKRVRSVSKGDTCNTFMLNLPNHMGTHIDCPNHFYASGKRISQYNINDFVFFKPAVLNCPKKENELITVSDIESNVKKLKGKDILLLRTNFYRFRSDAKYAKKNPGIDPEAARFIRARLTNIRCVGIDSISVSPYDKREMGRETHRIFFQNHSFRGRPLCVIEDMNLSGDLRNLKKVFVMPLFIKGIDSAPCTVLAILRKR